MQAIQTRYHGPASVLGARVSATASADRIIIDWDSSLNFERNHAKAARVLCDKLGWTDRYVGGGLKDGTMVWVPITSRDQT